MTSRSLGKTHFAYRIGDPDGEYPIFDAAGSTQAPGRWHYKSTPVIYTSAYYSTAMLEKLAHAGGAPLPPNQHFIEIMLPRQMSYETATKDILPGWDQRIPTISRQFGATWVQQQRSAILFVPSFVARIEQNILINPAHPEFRDIEVGREQPIWWDRRLFQSA